jgi:hypothetical protein
MAANPYQSPMTVSPRATRPVDAQRSKRLRIVIYSVGVVICVSTVLFGVLCLGTLAWISATPVSPERLAQIQWQANIWLFVIMSMLAGCVICGGGIIRQLRR